MNQPFLLGVNYWPRRKAMYWWSNFDAGEVHEEFALLRELGLDVVRLFLLWDDFQPAPDIVSSTCLNHLAQVCDIASAHQLRLDVTFFKQPVQWLAEPAYTLAIAILLTV